MKALTIRQPWASLIALGVKHIETRSWRAPQSLIGQTIAIHAGKHEPHRCALGDWKAFQEFGWELKCAARGGWMVEHFGSGMNAGLPGDDGRAPLPLGAIVATATLADCLPMIAEDDFTVARQNGHDPYLIIVNPRRPASLYFPLLVTYVDPGGDSCGVDVTDQLPYGDFAPGRWAWMLTNVQPCEPVPAKGKQGLWEWQE